MPRILIIEDDPAIAKIEHDYMVREGWDVTIATDGTKGLEEGLAGSYDLIILDLMLPGIGGFAICRKIRENSDVPILLVTALQDDEDKIRGLGMGADDYIVKPFSPKVLVAHIKANLAQYERLKPKEKKSDVMRFGDIEISPATRRVFVRGKEVELKHMEYELLLFLALHDDVVFDRETLYEKVWGIDAQGDTATVAVHINRLREKLEEKASEPKHLLTVWGAGYRFKP